MSLQRFDAAAFRERLQLAISITGLPMPRVALACAMPQLPQAMEVIAAWSFTFKTGGHWAKVGTSGKQHFGTGYILRNAGEPFLIATRGAPRTTRATRSVIIAPVREHSRKPDEAFDAASRLMPGAQRLELFSRQNRPGWTSWGDETGKFAEAAP